MSHNMVKAEGTGGYYDQPSEASAIVANLTRNDVAMVDRSTRFTCEVVGVYWDKMVLKIGYHWIDFPLGQPLTESSIRYAYSLLDGFYPLDSSYNAGKLGEVSGALATVVQEGVHFDEVAHRNGIIVPIGDRDVPLSQRPWDAVAIGHRLTETMQYVQPTSLIGRMITGMQHALPRTRQ